MFRRLSIGHRPRVKAAHAFMPHRTFAATTMLLSAPSPQDQAVRNIATVVNSNGGQLPLSRLIHTVTPATKQCIMRSGKGLEGFVRGCAEVFGVGVQRGEKMVTLLDETYADVVETTLAQEAQSATAATTEVATAASPASSEVSQADDTASPQAAGTTVKSTTSEPAAETSTAGAPAAGAPAAEAPTPAENTKEEGSLTEAQKEADRRAQPVLRILAEENKWYNTNDLFNRLYGAAAGVKYSDFDNYVKHNPRLYWWRKGHVSRRFPHQTAAPAFADTEVVSLKKVKKSPQAQGQPQAQAQAAAPAAKGQVPFGGWGAANQIPSSEDIFEMLKFVPVHWVNFGNLTIPADLKKKHIRISRALLWFAKQPKYFELRIVAGTMEVRRAVVLHPDAHNMTKEEAEQYVAAKIAEDEAAGEPVIVQQARMPQPKKKTGVVGGVSTGSAQLDNVTRIMIRVCPGYFVTGDTIIRRATKSLTEQDLIDCVEHLPQQLEMISIPGAGGMLKLFRRKTGVDTSAWLDNLKNDVASADNLQVITSLMTHSCAQWDRTHFLYVRLPEEIQVAIGGFDNMVEVLRRHPHIFKVGEYFYKRCDASDPSSADDEEPTADTAVTTRQLEDNPYHLVPELAKVFHYLTPEEDATTLAHYIECSSPAMKSVLPPRLITVVQSHPDLFMYREVSPGSYAVSRARSDEDVLEMTPEQVTAEVMKLVPVRGIDAAHLNQTMPVPLRRAVTLHFGREGALEVANKNPDLFHIVRSPPYVTLFLKNRGE